MDKELVRNELAMYGVLYDGKTCTIVNDGKRSSISARNEYMSLARNVAERKAFLGELWREMLALLASPPLAINGGGERTQRMFVAAVKHLYWIACKSGRQDGALLKRSLGQDVNAFSESFMTKMVDLKIGFDWISHLIKADMYRMELLKALASKPTDKEAIQGPWSNLDLPMQERVWSYSEEGENLEEWDKEKQNQNRYRMQDTYNDPYSFEEGFYYREMRNEPYAWDDKQEESPYPHRELLWDDDN